MQHVETKNRLQERVLATAMSRRLGDMTVRCSVRDDGVRIHIYLISESELPSLVARYREDPKECLAWAR